MKLVLIDSISSKPSLLFPIPQISRLCTSLKIPTLIDAAHLPGSVLSSKIDVESLGVTFFVCTFHKWCGTLRSAGGMYVDVEVLNVVAPGFWDLKRIIDTPSLKNPNLYLDAGEPGFLTDYLTKGLYDESTRGYENFIILDHCLKRVLEDESKFEDDVRGFREEVFRIWKEAFGREDYFGREENLPIISLLLPTSRLKLKFPTSNLKEIKKILTPKLWNEYGIEVPTFVWADELCVRISYWGEKTIEGVRKLVEVLNLIC